ncbi:polyprenyl synthetase family protein [Microbulbifer agarilyticus]|uniref:polyprenyl synthetase family protein n=1 Tax=Microbulbifer agarilyticus TaxID=260552 RepID=UPI001C9816CC|nr:farnesyl diphosphate synthase [Microbulbifer agarilyticus]MBY6210299.1 polyprenyl synthetase family protein [Microbulbifer agarilyticus]MCA0892789.1 polyprenyl synthetase family protein [Microbulbifer agarilyticus]
MPAKLKAFLQTSSLQVEQTLKTALADESRAEALFAAMQYAALGPGKRLRPALVYASALALGGEACAANCHAAAAALECIHAYSLVHDDLPAMDDDALRRGRPTCHIQFDEATAILAGDALQCQAFELLAAAPLAAELKVQLIAELAQASGARGMVAGQAIDLAAVDQSLTLEQLKHMHRLKTGALITASARVGALIGGADEAQLAALTRYAEAIGLAFQVQDDILDVTANTETLGKTQGADAARNKPTYVSLLGLEGAQVKAKELHREAHQALQEVSPQADNRNFSVLQQLADYIVKRDY